MAVNPNTGVQVIHLNTVTPAQVSVNYGPAFAVNVAGDHTHSEYVTHDDLDAWVVSVNDRIDNNTIKPDDPRLTDARTPTEHRHDYSEIDNTPTIPSAPQDIGAQPAGDYATRDEIPEVPPAPDLSDVVRDDDPRLSDAREPTAHSHPEYLTADDVPDLSAFVETDDPRLSDARTPLDHRHDMEDVEGLGAALADFQPRGEYLVPGDIPDLSDVVREDDPRLSDARTPTDHRHSWADMDDTPAIPASPEDIGAQPAGDYLTAENLPEAPDLSDVIREGDERLSDPRQPTSHRHNWDDLDGVPSIPQSPEDIGAQPAGEYLTASNFQIAGIAVNPTETPPDGWLVIRTE